jgi:hypothetical protein
MTSTSYPGQDFGLSDLAPDSKLQSLVCEVVGTLILPAA